MRDIVKCEPIATTWCARCNEVIYRDTLDKDDAWRVYETGKNKDGLPNENASKPRSMIVCSIDCAEILQRSDISFNKAWKDWQFARAYILEAMDALLKQQ